MSDEEELYEQEFESEEEQDYFAPKQSTHPKEQPVAVEYANVREAENEDEEDEYADDDFEEKSNEVVPDPPRAVPKPKGNLRRLEEDEEEDDSFFMTDVRPISKETEPPRRVSGVELRSNAQSSGKLTSVSHFDSPEKAQKYLSFLKKENISLRNELKQINDRLNEIIDQKIAEKPKRHLQPETREKATNTQLETAQKQLDMLKKEKIKVYKRLELVESPEYVSDLKESVEAKEAALKRLQKSQKRSRKTQQTREKDIGKELARSEMSLNMRVLQELQMENEGLRLKIRDLEREEERKAELAADLETQQEKLEQRYLKLMTVAKQNGTFEENSRENKRISRLKQVYEEQKTAVGNAQMAADTFLRQLKRQENELKGELETLRLAQKAGLEQMREKQFKMTALLDELQNLRPTVQGSGYESLLDRISTSIREKEAQIDKPVTPLRLRSLEEPLGRGKSATRTSVEGRKSPMEGQTEQKTAKLTKVEDSPFIPPKPQLVSHKPSLFSSGISNGKEEEKPQIVARPQVIEEKKEPEIVKRPTLSKPSLFSSVKTEEARETMDFIPTKEVKPEGKALIGDTGKGESLREQLIAPVPLVDQRANFPSPSEPLKPVVSSNPLPTDEIGTLDTFPSRRRGKKTVADPLPAVLPTVSLQASPNVLQTNSLQSSPSVLPGNSQMAGLPAGNVKSATDSLALDTGTRLRNRLREESQPQTTVKPAALESFPQTFESPLAPKPGRDRSHLIEEVKISNTGSENEDTKLTKRDRSHLNEPIAIGKTEKKENRTAELAKKAEKGGFFGDIEEEDLDFADLNKVTAKVPSLGVKTDVPVLKPDPFPAAVKKTDVPKPQILDLEESDIML